MSAWAPLAQAQITGTDLLDLAKIQQGIKSKRVSSFDKTGANGDNIPNIKPGEKRTIFDVNGDG